MALLKGLANRVSHAVALRKHLHKLWAQNINSAVAWPTTEAVKASAIEIQVLCKY
jgi:hypothetical protein